MNFIKVKYFIRNLNGKLYQNAKCTKMYKYINKNIYIIFIIHKHN